MVDVDAQTFEDTKKCTLLVFWCVTFRQEVQFLAQEAILLFQFFITGWDTRRRQLVDNEKQRRQQHDRQHDFREDISLKVGLQSANADDLCS